MKRHEPAAPSRQPLAALTAVGVLASDLYLPALPAMEAVLPETGSSGAYTFQRINQREKPA